jgi:Ran GTPase-activating protein (RanGAP) involved in mRNA processing and transport
MSPENAYLKVISKIGNEKMPDLFSPNLRPLNFDITNLATAIGKEPDNYFKNINNDLAQQFKKGKITRSEFLEDIARVDLLKDVYEVRKRVGGEEFAVAKSERKAFNFFEFFNQEQAK